MELTGGVVGLLRAVEHDPAPEQEQVLVPVELVALEQDARHHVERQQQLVALEQRPARVPGQSVPLWFCFSQVESSGLLSS